MKWRLDMPHQIDEQVLEAGTIIGDDTQWPFRALKDDSKIKRKKGDALPPSHAMSPVDDEARKVYKAKFGDDAPNSDPLASIPLTGAPGAPKIAGTASPQPKVNAPGPVNPAPKDDAPKTGMIASPKEG